MTLIGDGASPIVEPSRFGLCCFSPLNWSSYPSPRHDGDLGLNTDILVTSTLD